MDRRHSVATQAKHHPSLRPHLGSGWLTLPALRSGAILLCEGAVRLLLTRSLYRVGRVDGGICWGLP
jgi:hypothetical protein